MARNIALGLVGILVLSVAVRGQEILVSSEIDAPVPRPKVAMVRGGFVLAWNDGAGRRYDLAGNLLGSFVAGSGYYNDVAGNEDVGFAVAWESWDDMRSWAQRFDADGNALGEPFVLTPPAEPECRNFKPVIALGADGRLAVCWKRWVFDDDPRNAFFAAVFAADGTQIVPTFKVADFIGIHDYPAAIAMNARGEFAIAWNSQPDWTERDYHVYVKAFAADGAGRSVRIGIGPGDRPGVAMDEDGFAVISQGIVASWTLDGSARWQSDAVGTSSVALAMGPGGSVLAIWDDWTGGTSQGLFGRRFDAAGTAGESFQVNSQAGGMIFEPRAAANRAGDAVVAWPRETIIGGSFDMDVFARIYPAAAPASTFVRGDSNGDGWVEVSDVIRTLLWMVGRADVACMDAADFDDNGRVDLLDPIRGLFFLFLDGDPPEPPYPSAGVDPTPDALDCGSAVI